MIKIFIVEDSLVSREFLKHILAADKELKVIGEASRGEEAISKIEALKPEKPDAITMDIEMPGLDGYETTKKIMETNPAPIIIISTGYQYPSAEKTFRAMQAGAVAAIGKPPGSTHPDFRRSCRELINLIKSMSKVPVVRRLATAKIVNTNKEPSAATITNTHRDLVAIGASTGGPPALNTILSRLPASFPLPIVIVQHIASGFVTAMAEWLDNSTDLSVSVAREGEALNPGHAYVAPDDMHTIITEQRRIHLVEGSDKEILVPSVNMIFNSVAEIYTEHAIGVLLTGMGKDGAQALLAMRNKGALTIAQDRDSSIVYGMPGEAEKLKAAIYHLPPEEIATMLVDAARYRLR
jgi:two-component system chemotaxis response regulator CheB